MTTFLSCLLAPLTLLLPTTPKVSIYIRIHTDTESDRQRDKDRETHKGRRTEQCSACMLSVTSWFSQESMAAYFQVLLSYWLGHPNP